MTSLSPAAHAPYPDPETYILDWTDRIWSGRGMGLIREMYAPDLVVHGDVSAVVAAWSKEGRRIYTTATVRPRTPELPTTSVLRESRL